MGLHKSTLCIVVIFLSVIVAWRLMRSIVPENNAVIEGVNNLIEPYSCEHVAVSPHINKLNKAQDIFLLILVSSSPHDFTHYQLRKAIRETWGNISEINGRTFTQNVAVVFFMGRTTDNKALFLEAEVYKDLLIFDYYDTYVEITKKLISSLNWSIKLNPTFVLKTDDDVYINLSNLLQKLLTVHEQAYYAGIVYQTSVARDVQHRHYVSYKVFPQYQYPPFNLGLFYVLSGDMLARLLKKVSETPLFGVDDAYLGVLVNKLGVKPKGEKRFVRLHGVKYYLDMISDCLLQTMYGVGDGLTSRSIKYIHKRVMYLQSHPQICIYLS